MATAASGARTPAQTFALVFGVVYLLVGVAGFFVTGFDDFAGETFDQELILFPVNPLHNVVHLLLGAVWIAGASKHETAKTVNFGLGVALLLVAVLGMAGALKWLAIEDVGSTDNYLHLITGAASVYFGTAGART
jgi:hypothetical protein